MRFVLPLAILLAIGIGFATIRIVPAVAENPKPSDLWIDWQIAVYRQCLQGAVPFHPNCDWELAKALRHIVAVTK